MRTFSTISWLIGVGTFMAIATAGYFYYHPTKTPSHPSALSKIKTNLPASPSKVSDTPGVAAIDSTAPDSSSLVYVNWQSNYGRGQLKQEPIDEQIFEAAPPPTRFETPFPDSPTTDVAEQQRLQSAAPQVWRRGRSLYFKPTDAPRFQLITSVDTAFEPASFTYLASLTNTRQWLIEMWLYGEEQHYLLVNQRSGRLTPLVTYPSFSPSGRRLACGDATAEYVSWGTTTLELWEADNQGEFRLKWRQQMPRGVGEVRWADENTLLLRLEWLGGRKYVRLALP